MKKLHNWVLLENPRNGRVKITACSDCGTMKSLKFQAITECKPNAKLTQSLNGWKPSQELSST